MLSFQRLALVMVSLHSNKTPRQSPRFVLSLWTPHDSTGSRRKRNVMPLCAWGQSSCLWWHLLNKKDRLGLHSSHCYQTRNVIQVRHTLTAKPGADSPSVLVLWLHMFYTEWRCSPAVLRAGVWGSILWTNQVIIFFSSTNSVFQRCRLPHRSLSGAQILLEQSACAFWHTDLPLLTMPLSQKDLDGWMALFAISELSVPVDNKNKYKQHDYIPERG